MAKRYTPIYAYPLLVFHGKGILMQVDEQGITYNNPLQSKKSENKGIIGPIPWRDIAKIETRHLWDETITRGTLRIILKNSVDLEKNPYHFITGNVLSIPLEYLWGYPDIVAFLQGELEYRGYPDPNVLVVTGSSSNRKTTLQDWSLTLVLCVVFPLLGIIGLYVLLWLNENAIPIIQHLMRK